VLIAATKDHHCQLTAGLKQSGKAIEHLAKNRLQMLDARETLNHFMVHEHPSDQTIC
jgi:hypothetical protein